MHEISKNLCKYVFIRTTSPDIIGLSPHSGLSPDRCFVRNHDLVFMKNFAQVITVLMLITLGLILTGIYLNSQKRKEINPVALAATEARIAPVGAVFVGETGAAAQAAAVAAAAEAAKGQVAYGGTLDGGEIYGHLCTGCHTAGAAGAPTLDKAHWSARLAQGKDTLHKHAIEGIRAMPARGGNPALSDAQVIATVDWMISQIK
jgi:cytochrome c5